MFYGARDAAGQPLGTFDYMCRLLVPLCAARAAEEMLYGRDSMTLSTASEVLLPFNVRRVLRVAQATHDTATANVEDLQRSCSDLLCRATCCT